MHSGAVHSNNDWLIDWLIDIYALCIIGDNLYCLCTISDVVKSSTLVLQEKPAAVAIQSFFLNEESL